MSRGRPRISKLKPFDTSKIPHLASKAATDMFTQNGQVLWHIINDQNSMH